MKDIIVHTPGPGPLLVALLDELKIGNTIDSLVDWDKTQCKLSPGIRIEAMVLNILSGRTPLYEVEEFFTGQDLHNLFGIGVKASDFNDDCLARALDKLTQKGAKKVISTVLLNAIAIEKIDISHLHADTTSVSVYGEYDTHEEGFIDIVRGFSKDYRNDLKQLKIGLGVNQEGIPVIGEPLSGNQDDKTWNFDFIKSLSSCIGEVDLKSITYVADSALITEKNLAELQDMFFISRFPATFKLEKQLIELAWQKDNWQDIGKLSDSKNAAEYRCQTFIRTIKDNKYYFVVVHSSNLDKRKQKTIDKNIDKLYNNLKKEVEALGKREFACMKDAEAEFILFEREHKNPFYPLTHEVIEITRAKKKAGKGRPPKDYVSKEETIYRIKCNIGDLDQGQKQKAIDKAGCFALITNHFDKTPVDILREYKNQNSVETSFRFLKDPVFLNEIFMKKPSRIEALTYVMLLALFLYQVLQRRVRKALAREDTYLVVRGGVKTTRPTGKRILDLLKPINTAIVLNSDGTSERFLPANTEERVIFLLRLIGFGPEIYTIVRPDPFFRRE
jgi:transposase